MIEKEVGIQTQLVELRADLMVPKNAFGVVLFAHGSGSGRFSPRNKFVADVLNKSGIATLLLDLLTEDEEKLDEVTGELRFNIDFLAERLVTATNWVMKNEDLKNLNIGYFGASTGAAAALVAGSRLQEKIKAIVSRGGRPDLAGSVLSEINIPTLLIVGGSDFPVTDLNRQALEQLGTDKKELMIIPGATHLFEEPGALGRVAKEASEWFQEYLR